MRDAIVYDFLSIRAGIFLSCNLSEINNVRRYIHVCIIGLLLDNHKLIEDW
jgi:hypothetical protein